VGEYKKPWLTFEEQAELLINERGLIADRNELISHLADVGYYRLSGYWYIFKRNPKPNNEDARDERFVEGTTFDKVWKLYTFDRQFRLVVLDAIERVEVYFRTRPIIPTKTKYPEWHEPYEVRSDNMFGILTILSYLLERIAPETSWRTRLFSLLTRLDTDELRRMGFTEGWSECPLWKPYLPVAIATSNASSSAISSSLKPI
jgi:abortive infection bacteriophage resistance protein